MTDTDPKICALDGCTEPVHRAPHESPSSYRRRRYCTPDHAHQARCSKLDPALFNRECARDGCNNKIERRERQSAEAFAKVRFCSQACYQQTVTNPPPRNTCALEGCTKPIVRQGGETSYNWRKRKFCCNNHAITARNATFDPELFNRVCAKTGCTNPITRRPKESPRQFRARRYCSQQCAWSDHPQPANPKRRAKPTPPPAPDQPVTTSPQPIWRPANLNPQPREPRPIRTTPRQSIVRRPTRAPAA